MALSQYKCIWFTVNVHLFSARRLYQGTFTRRSSLVRTNFQPLLRVITKLFQCCHFLHEFYKICVYLGEFESLIDCTEWSPCRTHFELRWIEIVRDRNAWRHGISTLFSYNSMLLKWFPGNSQKQQTLPSVISWKESFSQATIGDDFLIDQSQKVKCGKDHGGLNKFPHGITFVLLSHLRDCWIFPKSTNSGFCPVAKSYRRETNSKRFVQLSSNLFVLGIVVQKDLRQTTCSR